jgi:hypothetical protein
VYAEKPRLFSEIGVYHVAITAFIFIKIIAWRESVEVQSRKKCNGFGEI